MKVAIITRNANAWVFFVVARLTSHGIPIVVINERRRPHRPRWASIKFLRRRGLFTTLDLVLQWSEAALARLKRGAFRPRSQAAAALRGGDFDAARPFEFRSSLTALAEVGIGKQNSLLPLRDENFQLMCDR